MVNISFLNNNTSKSAFRGICLFVVWYLLFNSSNVFSQKAASQQVPKIIYEVIESLESIPKERKEILSIGYSDLITDMEEVLKKDPSNVWVMLNVAYCYQRSFDYRKALEYYLRSTELAPESADPWFGLGRLYYDLALMSSVSKDSVGFQFNEKAITILELAREKLLLTVQREQLTKVDEETKTITSISPKGETGRFLKMTNVKLFDYYFDNGVSLTKKNDFQNAIDYFNKAIKINAYIFEAHLTKGYCFTKLGQFEEAIDCYNEALEINPKAAIAWFSKALCLEMLGRAEASEKCYKNAQTLDPELIQELSKDKHFQE